ncbi:Serine-rich coiled-coil domain-containing protein 2 [Collichthys lucidus]|uniref:Serine-rich coiled-coil domain-containing protein 2 n=1 Tax=Collichthys lucidus TaxID=240159 RepID=A0A4V6ATQ1_COLLU|nr:Serine-rich coiled-coil domain-containing protein 2 [Collichthys lucidus]
MSAPPLHDPPTMPTMVSRLPKFSSRPKPPASLRRLRLPYQQQHHLPDQRFYHHPGPVGFNGSLTSSPASAKQNGFIRVPASFSMKWRKENEVEDGADGDGRRGKGGNVGQNRPSPNQYYSQRQQPGDARKPAPPSGGRGRGFGLPVTSLPSPHLSPRSLPVSKTGSRPGHAMFGLTSGTKPAQNGLCGSKRRSGASGALKQPQTARSAGSRPGSGPGSRSGSPLQNKQQAGRSHSSDSLGSAPPVQLTESDRFRSRSLTQVRRQPSPTLTPSSTFASTTSLSHNPVVTRSYSINRAAGRAAPPRASVGGGGVKGRAGFSIPSLLLPSALKKPLLPSLGPASKPSGISYKLSRPSLNKQPRPPASDPSQPDGGRPGSERTDGPERLSGDAFDHREQPRNDISQEYMDDFDNLGNGGVGILLLSSKNDEDDSGLDQSCARFDDDKVGVSGVRKASGLCFLDDGVDWTGMTLSGEREHRLTRLPHPRRSSQPDYHDQGGSSLDLSPSDSCGSGGTYMWDEEGLEPLGGATTASIHTNSNTTHHIGSFDSDLNSIDILNNLESCDLDDDDLMLDSDVLEEASLHSDGDGLSHMAEWRRRQLCWGTQDVHNDNDSDFQCFKLTEDPGNQRTDTTRDGDLILDLRPSR